MDDPNILDIDPQIFSQIELILENESTRNSLLSVIPPTHFSNVSMQIMDNKSFKYNMTAAKWLLTRLGRSGVRVSTFIQWLDQINLERAMILLKKDVPIQITEQPPQFLTVRRGSKLVVSCKAQSYPRPEYQWFKENEELLLQQESELSIDNITVEDVGIYSCLISKQNLETEDISWVYSEPVHINVIEDFSEDYSPGSITNSLNTEQSSTSDSVSTAIATTDLAKISIVKQPYVKGRVPQGMSVTLHCKAKSEYPVKYQWYKNGRPLNGSISRKLHLNYLYPDPNNGDMEWQYFCKVSNEYDEVCSQTVNVQLENANDTTPYYASEKYAFMVANDKYHNLGELRKPAYDVVDLGNLLQSIQFKIFGYRNLTLTGMKNAFHKFCEILKPNSYVLFYFAGHGFDHCGQTYLNPVDCSDEYIPEESICAEDILKSLQVQNPSLNVLLIDSCRNPPPKQREDIDPVTFPVKLFDAKMKNNTVYGYSTTCSSYESDSERNSFFAKYLKRYITHSKSIQDILLQVQRDFECEPLTTGLQYPVIKSSLCGNRKLCDKIENIESLNERLFGLDDIKSDFAPKEFNFSPFKSIFTVRVSPHLDIFINVIDVTVELFMEHNTPLEKVHELEVTFFISNIQVSEHKNVLMENLEVNINNVILKKEIYDFQKLKGDKLDCKLLLQFSHPELPKLKLERSFTINVKKISDLKLFENDLG